MKNEKTVNLGYKYRLYPILFISQNVDNYESPCLKAS